MAATNLLALIDDIATLLDDVAVMSKIAAKKTAGVLGDDLALNAQQVTGIAAEREIPVVWAVAKGSLVNKCILVPTALLISWILPRAITPLLMLGGLYLCFEGCEKLVHKFLHPPAEEEERIGNLVSAVADPAIDLVAYEKEKIKGAIRTDFILSAEIVVLTLGIVSTMSWQIRVLTMVAISLAMTVGVYGLVAGIVKLDDLGLHWKRGAAAWKRKLGGLLVAAAPWLMKALGVIGTIAMFLVGGGIVVHGIPVLHHRMEHWPRVLATAGEAAVGVLAGAVVLGVVTLVGKLRKK